MPYMSCCYGSRQRMWVRNTSTPTLLARFGSDLFPKLKSVLRCKRFETNNDVIEAVDAFLRVQKFSFFYEGIAKLEDRWNKCTC